MIDTYSRFRFHQVPAGRALAVILGVVFANGLLAADPMTMAPNDVAGVVLLRDLKAATQKINPFLKQINPDYEGLDPDEFGEGFNLTSGEWDPSSPVIIVLTRPEFSRDSMVIGFKPADGSKLLATAREKGKRIWKRDGSEGEYSMCFRGGWIFAGSSVKALRLIRHRPDEQSFAGALDEQEKKLASESDVFVRFNLNRWREKISPFMMLGLGMMKLSAAAETHSGENVGPMLDWLAGGIRSCVDQMESTSLAFSFDRETFFLNHHHRFTAGQSVANYLSKVQPGEGDLLGMLPNRPFLMFAAANWHSPTEECLSVSMSRHIMGMETVAAGIPEETRRRLTKEIGECYGQVRGSVFMVTSEPEQAVPLRLLGGYCVTDSSRAFEQLCFIHENSVKAMASMLPGSCGGKFTRRRDRGVDFMEMNFNADEMPEEMRAELKRVYGAKARYQQAVSGPNRVLYAFAEPPMNIVDLVKQDPENRVDKNAAVNRILSRLPNRPHVVVVFDLERVLVAVPYLSGSATSRPATALPPQTAPPSDRPSRGLIGWAAVARPTSISGQLVMDARDAVETFKLARQMPQNLTKMSKTPGSRSKIVINP